MTFLFTDIEGSTGHLAELPDQYPLLLGTHDRLMRTAITGHGGTEVRTEGDAFFAAFPSALGAVAAAAEAQQAIAATAWPEGIGVRGRMGLHTGEGRIGGDDYIGLDVHRAARIAAAGHGGQVVLSAATQSLVEHDLPDSQVSRVGLEPSGP